jgi:predicted AAA+ superfamily ATPase
VDDAGYLPRIIDGRLLAALESFPIVILDGPRAVGKTTTAVRVANSTIRLPEDLPLLAIDAAGTLAALTPPVLIDEWQLAGIDLLWTLKRLADDDPTPGRFLLTGSVEPASHGPTHPLTGRAVNLVMYPMTAAELAGAGHEPSFVARLLSGAVPQPQSRGGSSITLNQLFTTGFPAARLQSDPSMFLQGYAALVAQRAGDEGRDASRLLRTLAVLGVLTAQAVLDQRIWESADINKATWKSYEDLLARVHLSAPIAPFSSNTLKRLTGYPKRMLVDTALALAVANLTIDDLRRDPALTGRYVESYVAQQLRPQVAAANGTLRHVRTTGGDHEVDLLADVSGRRYAFEVKAGTRPDAEDTKHLRWLKRELGDDLALGVVVHTGADTYPLGDDIWAVPLSDL